MILNPSKFNGRLANFVILLVVCFLSPSQFAIGAEAAGADKGKIYADFRLRYESVSQDNPLPDADALTLRSRVGLKSASFQGFSGLIELENNLDFVDDFSVPPAGVRAGQYSVIADPQTFEVDQAFLQFKNSNLTAKLGRQVIALDGQRFVGHVGWRQDRQTFDAASISYQPSESISMTASYLFKRNRIFADEADIDSEDLLLNTSYKTPIGKLVAYAYLLEMDNGTNNSLDTFGISLTGAKEVESKKFLYALEYATQEANDVFDTDYLLVEGGIGLEGITAKLGYEVLGSDGGEFGFATPLATLHKFNGWADSFLGTPAVGLEDLYASVAGKLAGGKWVVAYHDYSADKSRAGVSDLGDEINLLYARKFGKHLSGGVKFAAYEAGDAGSGKVDTDKFWLWTGFAF